MQVCNLSPKMWSLCKRIQSEVKRKQVWPRALCAREVSLSVWFSEPAPCALFEKGDCPCWRCKLQGRFVSQSLTVSVWVSASSSLNVCKSLPWLTQLFCGGHHPFFHFIPAHQSICDVNTFLPTFRQTGQNPTLLLSDSQLWFNVQMTRPLKCHLPGLGLAIIENASKSTYGKFQQDYRPSNMDRQRACLWRAQKNLSPYHKTCTVLLLFNETAAMPVLGEE